VPDAPYRAPLPVPPDPYAEAWAKLLRRRRLAWTALAFQVIAILWAMAPGPPHPDEHPPVVRLLCVAFACFAVAIYARTFRCPRCGGFFDFDTRDTRAAIRQWTQCAQCGIAIGTTKAAADEAEEHRAAGAPAEQSAEAVGYRVAGAQNTEAVVGDDELDATDDVSHARSRR
jgi:hypothetical protein